MENEYNHKGSQSQIEKTQTRLSEKYFPQDGQGKRPFSVTIHKKSLTEVFQVLQNIENLPLFFENLEKIQIKDANQADWYFKDLDGKTTVSIPMTLQTDPNSLIWKSETAAGLDYSVAFFLEPAPANRGTIVRMMVVYDTSLGELAGKLEALFGESALINAKKNTYRLKAFLETGHVPTTYGQPSGREEDMPKELKH